MHQLSQLSELGISHGQWIVISKQQAARANSTAVLRWIESRGTGNLHNVIDDGLELN